MVCVRIFLVNFLLVGLQCLYQCKGQVIPVVVNTWAIPRANEAAWASLVNGSTAVDAIVHGCGVCEDGSCGGSIGAGGGPDEQGETTLDAMIMDGITMDAGSVASLRDVQNAIGVARAVMDYTEHSVLVGKLARDFAVSMGFPTKSLQTNSSYNSWQNWLAKNCQPNFRRNVTPDPKQNCGPYTPIPPTRYSSSNHPQLSSRYNPYVDEDHHDTIGMVAIDTSGNIAAGSTTNGAARKVPGRAGDSPIIGSGAYAEAGKGACAGTGDGDMLVRLVPCFHAVQLMGQGYNVTAAGDKVIENVIRYYPQAYAGIVLIDSQGNYGAACNNFSPFQYNVADASTGETVTFNAQCK